MLRYCYGATPKAAPRCNSSIQTTVDIPILLVPSVAGQFGKPDQQSSRPSPIATLSLMQLAHFRQWPSLRSVGNIMGSRLVLAGQAKPPSGGAMAAWPGPRFPDRGGEGGLWPPVRFPTFHIPIARVPETSVCRPSAPLECPCVASCGGRWRVFRSAGCSGASAGRTHGRPPTRAGGR
jgi:hypothetical protein